jgi:hypothetical protein
MVGLHFSGMDVSYPGYLHQYFSHFFGITFIYLGDINPKDKEVEILKQFEPLEGIYHLLIFDKGALFGVNLINGLEEVGRLKTGILRKLTKGEDQERYIFYPSSKPR